MLVEPNLRSAAPAGTLLRRAVAADAVMSGTSGIGLISLAPVLDGVLGPPAVVLAGLGAVFVLWAAYLVLAVRQPSIPPGRGLGIVIGNLSWVVASVVALVADRPPLTGVGVAVTIGQAAAVLAVAEVQYLGLRRVRRVARPERWDAGG